MFPARQSLLLTQGQTTTARKVEGDFLGSLQTQSSDLASQAPFTGSRSPALRPPGNNTHRNLFKPTHTFAVHPKVVLTPFLLCVNRQLSELLFDTSHVPESSLPPAPRGEGKDLTTGPSASSRHPKLTSESSSTCKQVRALASPSPLPARHRPPSPHFPRKCVLSCTSACPRERWD